MIGDYYRYAAEHAHVDSFDELKSNALHSYNDAMSYARNLGQCNPIKIGLGLNMAVFYYEIIENHEKAFEIGNKTLEEAKNIVEDLDEDSR